MSTLSLQHLLPISRPGTPRIGSRSGSPVPGTPISRPRTPLFGKFEDGEAYPGWQTKGSVITQALPLGRFSRWRFRVYLVFFLVTIGLVIAHAVVCLISASVSSPRLTLIQRLNPRIVSKILHTSTPAPYRLQVLIHAPTSSPGLCRTLMTGAILNYPTPMLINWGKNFTDETKFDRGARFAKLNALDEYVTRMSESRKDDLLLLLDAEDLWFQLRPNVLVERFRGLIRQSDSITRHTMGAYAASEERIKSAAIFGSRKTCTPNKPDDIGCYTLPESPLPADTYGMNTDTEIGHTQFSSFRPRYLDSSVIMAPALDVRQMMLRAESKEEEPQRGAGGSDQSIFNTMLGQQEFQRQVMHFRHLTFMEKIKRWMGNRDSSILDEHPTREKMEHLRVRTHDFGMGLDYFGSIAHQTSDSLWDGRFIKYNTDDIKVRQDTFDCKPTVKSLPEDIQSTYITSVRVPQESLRNVSWGDLPLYTDICTGSIPVIVNYQGDAAERDTMWKRFWMQPIAKELFREQHKRATLSSPEDIVIDTGINSGGARTLSGGKLSWEEICGEHEAELFGLGADEQLLPSLKQEESAQQDVDSYPDRFSPEGNAANAGQTSPWEPNREEGLKDFGDPNGVIVHHGLHDGNRDGAGD